MTQAGAPSANANAAQPAPGANGPLTAALGYWQANLSVIPIRADGSKRPAVSSWERFQQERPTDELVRDWWRSGTAGIGIIGGAVSGNLECIDFDRGELFAAWRELVEAQVLGLVARLCLVRTPRQPEGYHVRYCTAVTIPGNMRLASEPGTDPKTGKPCQITSIETRGEGGYALAPGSPPSCHPTGRTWDHIAGPPLTQLPDITAEQRDVLIAAARSFDRAAAAKTRRPAGSTKGDKAGSGLRPGDDYDRRGPDWPEILEPHGWQRAYDRGRPSTGGGQARTLQASLRPLATAGARTVPTCSPCFRATPIPSRARPGPGHARARANSPPIPF